MILLYPPHARLKTIKHNPKASLSWLWMCTCYCSRFGFQPPLKRQGPITILSRLCWFSGSNPCSRCLLSTHLLWQPPDKQWVLKEVSHNQIFPAERPLKRSFLSPSSGTRAIELAPGIPPLRWAMGQCFAPPRPRPPSFSRHTCTPKAHRGNRRAASATWTPRRASWAHLTTPLGVKAHRGRVVPARQIDGALRTFFFFPPGKPWRSLKPGRLRNLRSYQSNLLRPFEICTADTFACKKKKHARSECSAAPRPPRSPWHAAKNCLN